MMNFWSGMLNGIWQSALGREASNASVKRASLHSNVATEIGQAIRLINCMLLYGLLCFSLYVQPHRTSTDCERENDQREPFFIGDKLSQSVSQGGALIKMLRCCRHFDHFNRLLFICFSLRSENASRWDFIRLPLEQSKFNSVLYGGREFLLERERERGNDFELELVMP